MHVRVRIVGKPDTVVVVESKLTRIDAFRRVIREKFDVEIQLQRLFYGGKLLEDGYTFHDYNIKLNDVIQLMVKAKPDEANESKKTDEATENVKAEVEEEKEKKNQYQDASSVLYAVGDLIDMKDREQGAWFEGKIVRIVQDPDIPINSTSNGPSTSDVKPNSDQESDLENKPPAEGESLTSKTKRKGIAKYFSKPSKAKKKSDAALSNTDHGLLYTVKLDGEEDETEYYCKLKEIRPRARTVIDIKDLKVGQTVMINHNTEEANEKGYWYDFKVSEIVKKLRNSYQLIGTLYLGPEAVPQNDTKVNVLDKIFAIEEVVPISERTEEYMKSLEAAVEKRSQPLHCVTCRDDEDQPCKDCGCFLCLGKENPEKIVLCDECNKGYHMKCLTPPLSELPEEDWYCPTCKRDPNDVIAPGAARQAKKAARNKNTRDWGRGMACVGKTKTCSMPPNHFGPIPGIEVGMCWRFRIQLSESGVHRPPVSGIHGRDVEGAYSIVLSGGYEDDVDHGYEFTYTGSGGRDLSGNKRTAEQSCDQTLTRENKALARNCAVKEVSESGGDAGDNWKSGKPVRVVRSYKMLKHFPKFAPKEGIRYDGIYKVVKYYPEKGLSGYRVWKYLLRRDDPSPSPWEPEATEYPIIYPDGYLEAEAEKKALKERNGKTKGGKKRSLKETEQSHSDGESPPGKKRKTSKQTKVSNNKSLTEKTIPSIFSKNGTKSEAKSSENVKSTITDSEREVVQNDKLNTKLWEECLDVCEKQGKKEFVEHISQVFLCIICQEVAANPVTTPCLHNFCMPCLKMAYKATGAQCPYCRLNLTKYEPEINEQLKVALQTIMPGYDAGKK